ncbi:hypothetical protein ALC62_02079 [Cyphomyrmex costatus]|uniref:Uncharacterized protein n=1 Tax=Cyphomyrmex costatus TaxID=456900 RepID=A0A151INC2_9HYME|nr:hypothetical protein ALC62_02079 [Cyphomyrmex costatus]
MDDSPSVAGQSAFPTSAPFSTWISPNNFGDFHPNPLMSLLTGNGQIEYPVEAVGAISRIHVSKRQRAIPIIFLATLLQICVSTLPAIEILYPDARHAKAMAPLRHVRFYCDDSDTDIIELEEGRTRMGVNNGQAARKVGFREKGEARSLLTRITGCGFDESQREGHAYYCNWQCCEMIGRVYSRGRRVPAATTLPGESVFAPGCPRQIFGADTLWVTPGGRQLRRRGQSIHDYDRAPAASCSERRVYACDKTGRTHRGISRVGNCFEEHGHACQCRKMVVKVPQRLDHPGTWRYSGVFRSRRLTSINYYSHRFKGKMLGDQKMTSAVITVMKGVHWMLQEARSSYNDDVPLSVKSFARRSRRTPEKVAIQQNSASTGTKAYVIAADTERMKIAVVQWREVEAHNLSNVDAKPLTLPCSVIAHLTKPRCETSTFPSSLSSEGYRVVQIHQLFSPTKRSPGILRALAFYQRKRDSRLIVPAHARLSTKFSTYIPNGTKTYRGELPGISV